MVKSGLGNGVKIITLDHFDPDTKRIEKNTVCSDCIESVYADSLLGPSNSRRFSAVLVGRNYKSFWFAQMLHLFHVKTRIKETINGEFPLERYFDLTPPISNIDRTVNELSLRWATENEVHYSVIEEKSSKEHIEVGE